MRTVDTKTIHCSLDKRGEMEEIAKQLQSACRLEKRVSKKTGNKRNVFTAKKEALKIQLNKLRKGEYYGDY
jgi:hypothetical protein